MPEEGQHTCLGHGHEVLVHFLLTHGTKTRSRLQETQGENWDCEEGVYGTERVEKKML